MIATGLKLNLGAGDLRIDGFVSVDLREDVADVVADVRHLPYEDGSVDAIAACDLIEHFQESETMGLLTEWRRVLRPGGELELKLPNLVALCHMIVRRAEEPGPCSVLIRNLYGGHRWGENGELDCHHWGWTPAMLRQQLSEAGFVNVTFTDELNYTVTAVAA